jgi:hypothetical protein
MFCTLSPMRRYNLKRADPSFMSVYKVLLAQIEWRTAHYVIGKENLDIFPPRTFAADLCRHLRQDS